MHQILMRLCTCWLLACPCFLCATRCMSCACVLHCGWVVGHQMPPSPRQHPVDCHPWGWVVGRKAPPSPWQHPSACHRRGWTVPHGLGRRAQNAPVAPAAWLPPLVVRHKTAPLWQGDWPPESRHSSCLQSQRFQSLQSPLWQGDWPPESRHS